MEVTLRNNQRSSSHLQVGQLSDILVAVLANITKEEEEKEARFQWLSLSLSLLLLLQIMLYVNYYVFSGGRMELAESSKSERARG